MTCDVPVFKKGLSYWILPDFFSRTSLFSSLLTKKFTFFRHKSLGIVNHQHLITLNSKSSPADRCNFPSIACFNKESGYTKETGSEPIQARKDENAAVNTTRNTV